MADGTVLIDTELDPSGLRKGLAALGGSVGSILTKGLAAATTALAGLGTYAIAMGSDFESAMSGVAATWGTTVDQIDAVKQKAIELGAATKFSATEVAQGFDILAQAGYSTADAISLIEPVLNLAAAGELELAEASTYVSATWKVMGETLAKEGHDATYIVDLYAKGATLAMTTTGELGDAVSTAAGYASQYNQSLDTTTTLLLAMADANFKGSEAGTLLRRAMMDIYAPGDQAAKTLEAIGVSAYDANGHQRDFVDVIYDIKDALSGLTEQEQADYINQIFSTVQGQTAFNAITAKSREEISGLRDELTDCAGAAEQMAQTKLDNLKGDLEELSSATEGFGIDLYDHMVVPLRDLVQEGTSLINQLDEALKTGGLSGLASSVGDALAQAVDKISDYAPSLVASAIDLLDAFVGGIASSASGISDVCIEIVHQLITGLSSLASSLIELGAELIIALCEGVAGSTGSLVTTFAHGISEIASTILEYAPQILAAGVELIKALATGIMEAFPEVLGKATELLTGIGTAISASRSEVLGAITSLVSGIASALPGIISVIVDAVPEIIDFVISALVSHVPELIECGIQLFTSLVSALPDIASAIAVALPSLVSGIVGSLLSLLPMMVQCGVQLFVALVQAMPDIIASLVETVAVLVPAIIMALVACIPSIIECGIQLFTSLVSALPQIILNIVAAVPAIIASVVAALIESIPTIIETGVQLLTSLITDLPGIIVAILTAVPQIVTSLVTGFVGSIGQIVQAGIQLLSSLVQALPTIIANIVRAVPQIISALVSSFNSFIGQMVEAGSNLLHGLADGIGNAIGSVAARAVQAAQAVVSSVKSALGIASPSKVFRDEIGKQLMIGLANGVSDYSSAAVAAVEDVADDISDVDFDIPDPDFPKGGGPVDYGALEAKARSAVNNSAASTQGVITNGQTGNSNSNGGGGVGTQVNIGAVNVSTNELKQDADYDRVGRRLAENFVREARTTGSLNPI